MTIRSNALPLTFLMTSALAACGSDPAEGPREQIIVAEPGEATSAAPESEAETGQEQPAAEAAQ